MPRGDRMGPNGMGSMTGRNLGYCNGYENPGNVKNSPNEGAGFRRDLGRGFGRSYGRGFGDRRFSNYPNYPVQQYSVKDEEKNLESEIDALRNQLRTIEARLTQLKKDE